jgi:hypothetical protein
MGMERELVCDTFKSHAFEVPALRAELREVIYMAAHTRWRISYNNALCACGNSNNQEGKADLALRACVERLWQIDLEETIEREEIYTALADLSILKILYRKYA